MPEEQEYFHQVKSGNNLFRRGIFALNVDFLLYLIKNVILVVAEILTKKEKWVNSKKELFSFWQFFTAAWTKKKVKADYVINHLGKEWSL